MCVISWRTEVSMRCDSTAMHSQNHQPGYWFCIYNEGTCMAMMQLTYIEGIWTGTIWHSLVATGNSDLRC